MPQKSTRSSSAGEESAMPQKNTEFQDIVLEKRSRVKDNFQKTMYMRPCMSAGTAAIAAAILPDAYPSVGQVCTCIARTSTLRASLGGAADQARCHNAPPLFGSQVG